MTPQSIHEGDDIAVEKGKIFAIDRKGRFPEPKEVIDATRKYVLPGIIDVHVHFREPGAGAIGRRTVRSKNCGYGVKFSNYFTSVIFVAEYFDTGFRLKS